MWSLHFKDHNNDHAKPLEKADSWTDLECWGWGPAICIFQRSSGESMHSIVQRPHLENAVSLPMVSSGIYHLSTSCSQHLAGRSRVTWLGAEAEQRAHFAWLLGLNCSSLPLRCLPVEAKFHYHRIVTSPCTFLE